MSGTSNPVSGRRGFGGVARNVAENLARLGVSTSLVTLIGDDGDGRALLENLETLGIGVGGLLRVSGRETASYTALLTPDGELALGLADMTILDGLTAQVLTTCAEGLTGADWVFADCNGSADLLAALAAPDRGTRYRLAVDPVSVAKSARLPENLDGIDLLILNRDEAGAALGRRGLEGLDPRATVAALIRAGAGAVVLTLGAEGALAADRDGVVEVPATPAMPVDVTGAGDSLIAAVLYALTAGEPLAAAVAFGCRAAAVTVASPYAVDPDLYATLIQQRQTATEQA